MLARLRGRGVVGSGGWEGERALRVYLLVRVCLLYRCRFHGRRPNYFGTVSVSVVYGHEKW